MVFAFHLCIDCRPTVTISLAEAEMHRIPVAFCMARLATRVNLRSLRYRDLHAIKKTPATSRPGPDVRPSAPTASRTGEVAINGGAPHPATTCHLPQPAGSLFCSQHPWFEEATEQKRRPKRNNCFLTQKRPAQLPPPARCKQ